MVKSQEELLQLKEEFDVLSNKLTELSEEELNDVTGGLSPFPIVFGKLLKMTPDLLVNTEPKNSKISSQEP